MSVTDDIIAANAAFAASFTGGELPASPARRVAVVACMDTRVDPYRALGLRAGEAHVLRNAGGVITDDVLRSLTISQRKLGTTEIVLIHHTRCGMTSFADDDFVAELETDAGRRPPWSPGAFPDTVENLRTSLAAVRVCPFLPRTDAVRGFVYDVDTGALAEFDPTVAGPTSPRERWT